MKQLNHNVIHEWLRSAKVPQSFLDTMLALDNTLIKSILNHDIASNALVHGNIEIIKANPESQDILVKNWKRSMSSIIHYGMLHVLCFINDNLQSHKEKIQFRRYLQDNFEEVLECQNTRVIDYVVDLCSVNLLDWWDYIHKGATLDMLSHFWEKYQLVTEPKQIYNLLLHNELEVINDYFNLHDLEPCHVVFIALYRLDNESGKDWQSLLEKIDCTLFNPTERSVIRHYIMNAFVAHSLIVNDYRVITPIPQWQVARYIFQNFCVFPPNIQDLLEETVKANDETGVVYILKHLPEEDIPCDLIDIAPCYEMQKLLVTLNDDYTMKMDWINKITRVDDEISDYSDGDIDEYY